MIGFSLNLERFMGNYPVAMCRNMPLMTSPILWDGYHRILFTVSATGRPLNRGPWTSM